MTLASLVLCISSLLLVSCTSIQWRGEDNFDHHLGMFLYEIRNLNCGEQLNKTSMGIDMRFSGEDRGISIGLKTMSVTKPDVTVIGKPAELGDSVMRYMDMKTKRCTPSTNGQQRWGIGYLVEDISRDETLIDSTSFGFELRRGPLSPGISLGYTNNYGYVGRATQDGIVQIQSRDQGSTSLDALALWALKPFTPGITTVK